MDQVTSNVDDAVAHSSQVMSFNGKRLIMDEMDFFAEKKSSPVISDQMVHQMELHVDVGKANSKTYNLYFVIYLQT